MDVNGNILLSADLLGEALVIGVPVGKDDSSNVVDVPTELGEARLELRAIAGSTGIDQDDAVVLCHEAPVDEGRPHAENAAGDLGEVLWHAPTLTSQRVPVCGGK